MQSLNAPKIEVSYHACKLAAMSERRIERLVNPAYSELPPFLVKEGGLNSGFMIAHCTAAALGKFSLSIIQPHFRPKSLKLD